MILSAQQKSDLKRSVPGLARAVVLARRARRRRRIRDYLAGPGEHSLNLGSGGHALPGWLNTDLVPNVSSIIEIDATRALPFPSGSFDRVFSEHMIEHIPFESLVAMVAECRRILRPGGTLRLATPDLAKVVRIYADGGEPEIAAYLKWSRPLHSQKGPGSDRCHVVNSLFYSHGHRFLYDFDTLASVLASAGFSQIRQKEPGLSDDPAMMNLESHGQVIGNAFNRLETLVVEARS